MKRLLAAMLAVIMLAGLLPSFALAAAQYATVVGGWLRLRSAASFEAETITSYYTDTVVEILGASGDWYRVKTPDGRIGYMYGDYLRLGTGAGTPGTGSAFVTSHNGYGVRLRKGPGTGYRIIRTYAVGTPVTVLERGSIWCRITIGGTTGYMMTQFLNFGSDAGNGNENVICYATVWSSNGYGVRLRSGPSTSHDRIGKYSVGTTVAVLEKGTVWDRIRVGSRTGWMMNEFLHYQNANELTGVTLNTMDPAVGTVMKVQAMTPASATVSYAWLVGGTVKGTNSTYTVSAADIGKRIQLKLSGTGSYSGMVVSAATNAVISDRQLSGLRLNTTAPVVGDILRASYNPPDAGVAYAWKIDGYQVSNENRYTVKPSDAGKVIELIVTGTGSYSGTLYASTAPVAEKAMVTGVSIRNETAPEATAFAVGDRLSAAVSPAQATVNYQWKRDGAVISSANSAEYVLTDADAGAIISVTVIGTGAYSGEKTAAIAEKVSARPQKPVIDEYALPDTVVGQQYAAQLTAQGAGVITWTVADGALPDGIVLTENGAFTGAAVREGTFAFTVRAANSAGSDEKNFAIAVAAAEEPELIVGDVEIPAQTAGYAQSGLCTVSITNIGGKVATLQQLYTQDGDAASFTVNQNGSSTIAAGATDSTWTIQPVSGLAAGTYTTTFVVRYDEGKTASASVRFEVKNQSEPVAKYVLTVEGGTAEKAEYAAGETVTIAAAAPDEGKIFSGWTASSQVNFADASAAVTTMIMPACDVTVTAQYADKPVEKAVLEIAEIRLPSVQEGYERPAAAEVLLKNVGNAQAELTALYTEGRDASAFEVNENGSSVIAAGTENATWTIRPMSGLSAGTYTAAFTVEYNGGKISADFVFVVEEAPPAVYQLTVENGSGSGSYEAGESVALKADAAPEGMAFERWTASAGTLADASCAETVFVMPESSCTVKAEYQTVQTEQPSGQAEISEEQTPESNVADESFPDEIGTQE